MYSNVDGNILIILSFNSTDFITLWFTERLCCNEVNEIVVTDINTQGYNKRCGQLQPCNFVRSHKSLSLITTHHLRDLKRSTITPLMLFVVIN